MHQYFKLVCVPDCSLWLCSQPELLCLPLHSPRPRAALQCAAVQKVIAARSHSCCSAGTVHEGAFAVLLGAKDGRVTLTAAHDMATTMQASETC